MSVMLYPCIVCVVLLIDLFIMRVACLTVFMNCLVKQFAICLVVVGGALLDIPYNGLPKSVCALASEEILLLCTAFCTDVSHILVKPVIF